jgi:putative transposase
VKRTIKLFFKFDEISTNTLFETMKLASSIFNDHVEWALKERCYSKAKAHKSIYKQLRERYPSFNSALLQSVRDTALESVKATKLKFHPRKSEKSAIRYDARTLSLRGCVLSISTTSGRLKTMLCFSKYELRQIEGLKRIGGAIVGFDNDKKKFFVCLTYQGENKQLRETGRAVGIDRGIKNPVATSDERFFGKDAGRLKRRYSYLQQQLSVKGTRSAKRLLKRLSGKEKRFNRDMNHVISKILASDETVRAYVLEDLGNITKRKRKSKMLNRWLHSWPFFQLEAFLKYKCEANGIEIAKVDARYTSQCCNCCGCVDKMNRSGFVFRCIKCGHKDHADVNAAKNIRDKYLTSKLCLLAGCKSITRMDGDRDVSCPRYHHCGSIN